MLTKKSLSLRLTTSILFVIFVFFSINVFFTVNQTRKAFLDEAYKMAEQTMQANIKEINSKLYENVKLAESLALTGEFFTTARDVPSRFYFIEPSNQTDSEIKKDYENLTPDIKKLADTLTVTAANTPRNPILLQQYNNIIQTFRRIKKKYPTVLMTYLSIEKTQECICDPDVYIISKHFYLNSRSWYTDATKSHDPSISTPYIDKSTGKMVVTAVAPMWSDNTLLGSVNIDFTVDTIMELVDNLKLKGKGFAFLTDSTGNIICHPDKNLIMTTSVAASDLFAKQFKDNFNMLCSGSLPYLEYTGNNSLGENGDFIVFCKKIPVTGWQTFLIVKKSELIQAVGKLTRAQIIMNIGFLVVLAVIIFFAMIKGLSGITVIINDISAILKEISEGKADLTHSIDVRTEDEVGQLAHCVNDLVSSLKDIIVNLKRAGSRLEVTYERLVMNTGETTSAAAAIAGQVSSEKASVEQINNSLSDVSSSMNSISHNLLNINNDIASQASSVEESAAAITQMVASLENMEKLSSVRKESAENLVEVTKSGGEKIQATKTMVSDVLKSVDSIVSMIELINGIASQTNLLSMNAAIEAAHAGEAGKGFSVVAQEIRKLAENSASNAKKIEQELKSIVFIIRAAADSSDDTEIAFANIEKEVLQVAVTMDELLSAIKEVSLGGHQIREATSLISEITMKVKQQSEDIAEKSGTLSTAMGEISINANKASASMEEIERETNLISNSITDIDQKAKGDLKSASDSIINEVGAFQTE